MGVGKRVVGVRPRPARGSAGWPAAAALIQPNPNVPLQAASFTPAFTPAFTAAPITRRKDPRGPPGIAPPEHPIMTTTNTHAAPWFRRTRGSLWIAAALGLAASPAVGADEAWTPLFRGRDFAGFAFCFGKDATENKGTFSIKDGVIVCSGNPAGYIYTTKSYSRYTLEYDWRFKRPEGLKNDADFGGNNGCLVHIGAKDALGVWPRCIEVQGMHNQAGLILPIPRDVKCRLTHDAEARAKVIRPVGEWNTTRITVDGGNMTIELNGTVVSTVADCELTAGPIGFQSEGTEVHFRNARIREQ